jgi:hypothetical protein
VEEKDPMGKTMKVLDEIREQIAPSDETLEAVRERRDAVLDAANKFKGVRDDYRAGSIAHGTANADLDADVGVVLDRRVYPELGPDGDGEGPNEVIDEMRQHLHGELDDEYSGLRLDKTKRAIKASFADPIEDEIDPTVDLIVALERRAKPGIWIPNMGRPGWDPSHPKKHTELLTAPPPSLRRKRARVIRLAKAWNGQYSKPGLSSFNIEALALACIEDSMNIATGLLEFFHYSADDIAERLTPDPANVSPAIKLLGDKDKVVSRLQKGAKLMAQALGEDDNEDAVREALSELFPKYVEATSDGSSSAALASALRKGNEGVRFGTKLSVGGAGTTIKTTRSHGGEPGVQG